MPTTASDELIPLTDEDDLWSSCFLVAPLVIIGSRDAAGEQNFAPKHMAMPLSWERYFGFVCTPQHTTYRNILASGQFTVTFPWADQVLLASLAAAPRGEDDTKPSLAALPTRPAEQVDGAFLEQGHLFLECELHRLVEGFGENCLIAGKVVAAQVHRRALRASDEDDQEVLRRAPLLAYVQPGRFTEISQALSFPFPAGFKK